ncbi:MAG TPA: lycopene cyclase family protein, partial [Bdellovibrionales bacterium]|nr:lycopene cyclase family protein [Bdellovibrionales bacterium]
MSNSTDLVIVGGGLAGGLTALIFKAQNPDRKITLIEQSNRLGGTHTWTFFEADISPEALEILKPMISKTWTETTVRFPRLERNLEGAFHMIRSEDFHRVVSEELGKAVRFQTAVTKLSDDSVTLEKGKTIEATCVFDARGLDDLPSPLTNGFQKYIGYDFVLDDSTPHG